MPLLPLCKTQVEMLDTVLVAGRLGEGCRCRIAADSIRYAAAEAAAAQVIGAAAAGNVTQVPASC